MAKFNVGDKVRFIEDFNNYKEGDVVDVVDLWHDGNGFLAVGFHGRNNILNRRVELAEPKITKTQRITKLEERLYELELIVNKMRNPPTIVSDAVSEHVDDTIEFEGQQYRKVDREAREGDVVIFTSIPNFEESEDVKIGKPYKAYESCGIYSKYIIDDGNSKLHIYGGGVLKGTTETVDVYELIMEDKPKTANELRAEIIEEAKVFIEKVKCNVSGTVVKGMPGEGTHMTFKSVYMTTLNGVHSICIPEFFVDVDELTVTVLLKGLITGKVYAKAIAKCHPDNVFNEHIGKAIALGRALGLDVSEFEQAVQPNRRIDGMVIEYRGRTRIIAISHVDGKTCDFDSEFARYGTIINDTNAQYGGIE